MTDAAQPPRWLPKGPVPENDSEPDVRFSSLHGYKEPYRKSEEPMVTPSKKAESKLASFSVRTSAGGSRVGGQDAIDVAAERVAIITGAPKEMIKEALGRIIAPDPEPLNLDIDPFGRDQHAPGAKLDAGKTRPGMVFSAFARAMDEVAKVGTYGADKYSEDGWLQVPNGEARYTDAMLRHYFREAKGEWVDQESDLPHAAHLAWNALARLELMLRKRNL
jgi:hypothetical protein